MNLWEAVRTALNSLSANKFRSFLTMLGVIIGVGSVVAMTSIGEGASSQVTAQISTLGSNLLTVSPGRTRGLPGMAFGSRGAANLLTYRHYTLLQAAGLPGITATLAEASSRAVLRFGKANTTTTVVGTTPSYPSMRDFPVALGRFFSNYDLERMTRVVVLGNTVAQDLFGDARPALGQVIRVGNVDFTVIGVMEPKALGGRDLGDQVFVPLTTAEKRLTGSQYVQSITVQATSPAMTSLVADELNRFFLLQLKDPEKFTVTNQQDILDTIQGVTGTLTLLLAGITGISLLVGGIGIMNIMLVSVTERTREIGIRKAVGARRRDVLIQFMVESATLSLLGGLVGLAGGAVASRIIARFSGWATVLSVQAVVAALVVSIGVGLFFGIYPAQRASRLDPIEALRYE